VVLCLPSLTVGLLTRVTNEESQKPARQQGLVNELSPNEDCDQDSQKCNDGRRN
jgi:hypothetical protein